MKVFKPLQISLLNKCYGWQKKHHFAVTCLLGFAFDEQQEVILEQDLWKIISEQLGNEILDIGMPKPQGEVLVYGSYFAPGGAPVNADDVGLKIGKIDKTLRVIGDRYWRALVGPTPPEPFKQLPLTYDHAFGGKQYGKNPLGKGLDEVDLLGEMRLPLPNIEIPDALVSSAGQRPMPAGFAPYRPEWEQRVERMGTYDEAWKIDHFPDYAPDMDWRCFNAAPEDQWTENFWRGDEAFELTNMHPQKSRLSGRLPGFRLRSFVARGAQADMQINEVEMRAETVCLFPEIETGIMIFRGSIEVGQDDASDLDYILCGFESAEEASRDRSYYEHAFKDRLDEKNTFKYMLSTQDLIPQKVTCGFAQLLASEAGDSDNELVKNVQSRAVLEKQNAEEMVDQQKQAIKQKFEEAGIDPALYLEQLEGVKNNKSDDPHVIALLEAMEKVLPGCTSGDGKPANPAAIDFEALKQLANLGETIAVAKKVEVAKNLQRISDNAGPDPAGQAIREQVDKAIGNLDQDQPLPRPPMEEMLANLDQQLAELASTRQQLVQQGVAEDRVPDANINAEESRQKMQIAMESMKQSYRLGAHYVEGRLPHKVPLDIVQHRFKKAWDKGESLAGGDYAGVDFSGLDLGAINLSGCYLEYANFSNASLKGADLSGAILTHANLSNARFSEVNFEAANLGGSLLRGAVLDKSMLRNAVLSRAMCTGASFIDCDLQSVDFIETKMQDVVFRGCRTSGANFIELEFIAAEISNCNFLECNFVKCRLESCDCSRSNFSSSNFVECSLDGSNFTDARLANIRLPGGSSARGCTFTNAILDSSNFRDVEAPDSNFEMASFQMADFSGANMQKSCFYAAIGKRTLLIKTDLSEANLSSVNLMEASLGKARLTNADLSHANLYSVDFAGATIGGTDFNGANLDLTILEEWHSQS